MNKTTFYDWCYSNNREDLIREWDYEKNKNYDLAKVTIGNGHKFWWKINYYDKKHNKNLVLSWDSTISHRINGRGCPYLSNPIKKILIGFNDLLTTNPELCKEWDYEKNRNELLISPESVTAGSTKKVFWKCPKKHSYIASISHRTNGTNCPYCSSKKVLTGFNDLATTNPELLNEWNYDKNNISPHEITFGAIKKVYWKCQLGHEWLATPNSRTGYYKTNCPYCSNKKILGGFNDLLTTNPELCKEWDYEKNELHPNQVVSKSNKKVWWRCPIGHSYSSIIYTRTIYNCGCPECNKERRYSFNEKAIAFYLRKIFLDIEEDQSYAFLNKKELDIFIPSLKLAIEYDGYAWHKNVKKDIEKDSLCEKNNIVLLRIREEGCPLLNTNSIKIELGPNKSNKNIEDVIFSIIKEIKKIFSINVDLNVNIDADYSQILNEYLSLNKNNSLSKKRPDLLDEWDYSKNIIKPDFIMLHSNRKVWWKCKKCEYSYQMRVNDKTGIKHSGCPVCASKIILKGINDLATTNPELCKEWDYEKNIISPNEITKGSHKKVWWKCDKDHSWNTSVYVRTQMKCNCPYCSNQKVLKGYNDLATTNPELCKEWDWSKNENIPSDFVFGSNKKVWWKCKKCGNHWISSIRNRNIEKRGCPKCNCGGRRREISC